MAMPDRGRAADELPPWVRGLGLGGGVALGLALEILDPPVALALLAAPLVRRVAAGSEALPLRLATAVADAIAPAPAAAPAYRCRCAERGT